MNTSVLALTELEVRLASPGGSALRDTLLSQLGELETRLRVRLHDGVGRDTYPVWRDALAAATAARQVLLQRPTGPDNPPASVLTRLSYEQCAEGDKHGH